MRARCRVVIVAVSNVRILRLVVKVRTYLLATKEKTQVNVIAQVKDAANQVDNVSGDHPRIDHVFHFHHFIWISYMFLLFFLFKIVFEFPVATQLCNATKNGEKYHNTMSNQGHSIEIQNCASRNSAALQNQQSPGEFVRLVNYR